MSKLSPFHLAIPVHDLAAAREFYSNVLGLGEGRSDTHWIDYDFWGHQFVVHLNENLASGVAHALGVAHASGDTHASEADLHTNPVDGHDVPVPHFGVVLPWEDWEALAKRLQEKGIKFAIEPYIRFKGKPGEQATMFFYDPSGNALEFKAFKDLNMLFAK